MGRRVLDKTRGRDDIMGHIFRLLKLNDFLIWIKFFFCLIIVYLEKLLIIN